MSSVRLVRQESIPALHISANPDDSILFDMACSIRRLAQLDFLLPVGHHNSWHSAGIPASS